ncbi:hypothetical protein EIL87_16085 [Saccharopolyspora rhizosphaerae]|uniref:Clp R domain-containing protein n=1 Tax=Saccharopolyspora rhizosphaerae TaxID=2492662 RepID=A0A3R8P340_9PSEU|nr:Clp protease N-terminal domain-containing protein [Saccharopolyspora rhizosphaerae]RRO15552.1 hypothetical protein EIL87_16085 [Saccharopolyspora rhizosphaerae]
MFERFTREARESVIVAQETSRSLQSPHIDTRHLLAGLASGGVAARALRSCGVEPAELNARIRDDLTRPDLDAEALAALGIDLDAVSARADEIFGAGALRRAGGRKGRGHVPFTKDAKKALELALREAIRLKHRAIDSRHVLLGLLRADCPGRTVLGTTGIDLDDLRAALEIPEAKSA